MSRIVYRFDEKLDGALEERKRSEETSLMGWCLGNIIGASEINLLEISQELDVTYEIIF